MRVDHRRGTKPLDRVAGATAPADQPRDPRAQAAADHADRSARAASQTGRTRARTTRAASDRPLPLGRAQRPRDRRLPGASAGGGRACRCDAVRRFGAAPHPPTQRRPSQAHQPVGRPCLARRFCPRPGAGRAAHRRAGGARGFRHRGSACRIRALVARRRLVRRCGSAVGGGGILVRPAGSAGIAARCSSLGRTAGAHRLACGACGASVGGVVASAGELAEPGAARRRCRLARTRRAVGFGRGGDRRR